MAEDTQHQIEERLAELPQDVRDAVLSSQLGEHLRDIGKKHSLHIDQIGKLEDETMLVMLGFFDPAQFNTQLEQQLLIPATDATAIAAEVTTAVFAPIRESLMHFLDMKRSDPATTTAPTAVAPSSAAQPAPVTPVATPVPEAQTAAPTPIKPMLPPMPVAEQLLTEKTAAIAPKPAAAPQEASPKPIYKADPYREPIE
jgi:hypothetical protein